MVTVGTIDPYEFCGTPLGQAADDTLRFLAENSLEVSGKTRTALDTLVASWRGSAARNDTVRCRICGDDIRWRVTPAGKRMPLDAMPWPGPARGTFVVVNDHECRPADPVGDVGQIVYMTHWAGCRSSKGGAG